MQRPQVMQKSNFRVIQTELITSSGITYQNLLGTWIIGIRHEEVSVLTPLMEPKIGAKNQLYLFINSGVVQGPQVLKSPTVQ